MNAPPRSRPGDALAATGPRQATHTRTLDGAPRRPVRPHDRHNRSSLMTERSDDHHAIVWTRPAVAALVVSPAPLTFVQASGTAKATLALMRRAVAAVGVPLLRRETVTDPGPGVAVTTKPTARRPRAVCGRGWPRFWPVRALPARTRPV
ncbi:DUF6069 family protein [Kitasatospora sp. NPDC048722]|uniref:DUF6069 family protein n=1 Tax=Kitasatospora sp. NPDC048722 TaxID=3155639 RepID=UPI0034057AA9